MSLSRCGYGQDRFDFIQITIKWFLDSTDLLNLLCYHTMITWYLSVMCDTCAPSSLCVQPGSCMFILVSVGWGVPQRAAAAAWGALPGPFWLHVHSAGGGGGEQPTQPQPWPPTRTRQLHSALVHISVCTGPQGHLTLTWAFLHNKVYEGAKCDVALKKTRACVAGGSAPRPGRRCWGGFSPRPSSAPCWTALEPSCSAAWSPTAKTLRVKWVKTEQEMGLFLLIWIWVE